MGQYENECSSFQNRLAKDKNMQSRTIKSYQIGEYFSIIKITETKDGRVWIDISLLTWVIDFEMSSR